MPFFSGILLLPLSVRRFFRGLVSFVRSPAYFCFCCEIFSWTTALFAISSFIFGLTHARRLCDCVFPPLFFVSLRSSVAFASGLFSRIFFSLSFRFSLGCLPRPSLDRRSFLSLEERSFPSLLFGGVTLLRSSVKLLASERSISPNGAWVPALPEDAFDSKGFSLDRYQRDRIFDFMDLGDRKGLVV